MGVRVITLSPQGRRLLPLIYVAALVILVDQSLDLFASIWPLNPGVLQWRFGAFGLGLSRLEFLALADAMAIATAVVLEHRRFLVVLAVIHLVLGIAILAGLGLFVLDGIQIR